MVIVAAVVVIVVVAVAVGAFAFLSIPAAPSNTNPTSAPRATSSTETLGPESSETADVAGASSLKYSVSVAENGVIKSSYTFWGKNVGKADFAMRIEYSDENGNGVYIGSRPICNGCASLKLFLCLVFHFSTPHFGQF